jgi:hypothetical protein
MSNLNAQQTIRKPIKEEEKKIDYGKEPIITNQKTSSMEQVLSSKEEIENINMGFSSELPMQPDINANDIKMINREITRTIHAEEIELLFKEHNLLVGKKVKGEISKQETKKLLLIRWKLDRIEDAFYGDKFDNFEIFLRGYEQFANDINAFVDNIRQSKNSKRHK